MNPAPPVTSAFPGRRDSTMGRKPTAGVRRDPVDAGVWVAPFTGPTTDFERLDRSFQTDVRAEPARPDGRRRRVGALALRPLDGAFELRLRHVRAALDLQALRLVVELLLRPRGARPAGRGRARPRLRRRPRLRGRP